MDSILSTATAASGLAGLPEAINQEHEACCRATGQALEHAMRCGDLLAEAKAGCEHGQWRTWLSDNFSGSARTAQVYMRLAANREAIEAKAQGSALLSVDGALKLIAESKEPPSPDVNLIPPNDRMLFFSREFSDGSKWLIIEPSVHPGYYFVSAVNFSDDEDRGSWVEGTKRPVYDNYLRLAVERLGALPILDRGERIECSCDERRNYNHWLFASEKHYLERQRADWQRQAEEGAA